MLRIQAHDVLLAVAICLLLAIAIHTIEFHHHHPEELFGTGVQAILHGDTRKFWLILALLFVATNLAAARSLLVKFRSTATSFAVGNNDLANIFDPLREALRTGILHPKLCE